MTLIWDVPIVHRDDHLLVLDKPAGIATTAPDGGHSLFEVARALDPRAPALHPLSRLDTQVTGLVTFARTERANRVALEARHAGSLRRAYLGIACHLPTPGEGDWTFTIALDERDSKHRRALRPGQRGRGEKAAHTHYRLHASAGPLCALDLWPLTGRTHQLRVHASAAGCALLGDPAYGGLKRLVLPNGRVLTANRVMLHCAAFRMPNPAGGGVIALHVAAHDDMKTLWQKAGGDPSGLVLDGLTSEPAAGS